MNSQNENSLKTPKYIFFDIKEQLSQIQTLKFEENGNCFFINEKDIVNILMDMFEDISINPGKINCSVRLDLLITPYLKQNGVNTSFGNFVLNKLTSIKQEIINKLIEINLREHLEKNRWNLDYYFHSLRGNIVVLQYLGTAR